MVLKTFHVQGGFDNSAENPPHPATVTFVGFPNAFPAERLKTAHLNSLLQQLSIFELLFPLKRNVYSSPLDLQEQYCNYKGNEYINVPVEEYL